MDFISVFFILANGSFHKSNREHENKNVFNRNLIKMKIQELTFSERKIC